VSVSSASARARWRPFAGEPQRAGQRELDGRAVATVEFVELLASRSRGARARSGCCNSTWARHRPDQACPSIKHALTIVPRLRRALEARDALTRQA
jgi:hypothetical protein